MTVNGDDATVTNAGVITTSGNALWGVFVNGDAATVSNDGGVIDAIAGGIYITGSDATVNNLDRSGGGFILTSADGAHGVEIQGDGATVDNRKSIETTGSSADGLSVTGDGAGLVNQAGADISTGQGMAIHVVGDDAGITNNGEIKSGLQGGPDADGIHVDAGLGAPGIANNLSIETYGSDSDGIFVDAQFGTAQIGNPGVIATADDDADGIELNGAAAYTVNNPGSIITTGDSADGIALNRSSLSGGAAITNDGDINVSGFGSSAIRLVTQAGDSTTVVNSGTLTSQDYAVNGGLGDETVRNFGVMPGDVYLDAGDDTFVRGANSTLNGTVYGGTESLRDTLQFALAGSESISGTQYVDFEDLTFSGSGTLSLIDELYVDTAIIPTGTTFTLLPGSILDVSLVTIVDGGTLSGNGSVTGTVQTSGGRLAAGSSIGALFIGGDLLLDNGELEFEADSPVDTDQLSIGGDMTLADGVVEVRLGYTPAPQDILEFLTIAGTLDIQPGFDGIVGIAKAGSGVALGTQFTVDLGGQLFQGTVTSVVPVPAAVWLFGCGLLGLIGLARRKGVP